MLTKWNYLLTKNINFAFTWKRRKSRGKRRENMRVCDAWGCCLLSAVSVCYANHNVIANLTTLITNHRLGACNVITDLTVSSASTRSISERTNIKRHTDELTREESGLRPSLCQYSRAAREGWLFIRVCGRGFDPLTSGKLRVTLQKSQTVTLHAMHLKDDSLNVIKNDGNMARILYTNNLPFSCHVYS